MQDQFKMVPGQQLNQGSIDLDLYKMKPNVFWWFFETV